MPGPFIKPSKQLPAVTGTIADADEYNQNIAGQNKDSFLCIDEDGNFIDGDLGDETIVSSGNGGKTGVVFNDIKLRDAVSLIKVYDNSGVLVRTINFDQATELQLGTAKIATTAQVAAGTDDTTIVTPAKISAALGNVDLTNNFLQRDFLTASGTWNKPASATKFAIMVVGGGGGGGGNAGGGGGGGGGAGGFSFKFLTSGVGATETVTVGALGVAGTPSVAGGTGGTSSFGSHCSATGGAGAASGNDTAGGAGGVGSSGDVNITGGAGGQGGPSSTGSNGNGPTPGSTGAGMPGGGGVAVSGGYGGGGGGIYGLGNHVNYQVNSTGGQGGFGTTGTEIEKGGQGIGAGGGGGASNSGSFAQRTGGPGATGAVIIWSYS